VQGLGLWDLGHFVFRVGGLWSRFYTLDRRVLRFGFKVWWLVVLWCRV